MPQKKVTMKRYPGSKTRKTQNKIKMNKYISDEDEPITEFFEKDIQIADKKDFWETNDEKMAELLKMDEQMGNNNYFNKPNTIVEISSEDVQYADKNDYYDDGEVEIWKPFPNDFYKNNYEVSNMGRVRNKVGQIKKQKIKNGYCYCNVQKNSEKKSFRVHILVAKIFVKNPNKKVNIKVNHIDCNKLNNNYWNLEWLTTAGNNQHAADNGLVTKTKRRVSQYDMGDKLIKIYDTLTDAYNKTSISSGAIVGVCKGKTTQAGGYVWKYVDENPNEKDIDPKSEGFKQLKSFPNYWISKDGRLYSKPFRKFMKFNKHATGCLQVQITRKKEGGGQIKKTILVHNLVAIYHKDNNKTNNHVNNLEWGFIKGNNTHFDI